MSGVQAAVSASQQLLDGLIVSAIPRNKQVPSIQASRYNYSQLRNAARYMAQRCQGMYSALKQHEKIHVPDRMVKSRDVIFQLLREVEGVMNKWSKKGSYYMLAHQRDFEVELEDCKTKLFDCLMSFTTAAQMELLAYVREDERWVNILNESQFTESQNDSDIRATSTIMQAVLAGKKIMPQDKRTRMTMDLYSSLLSSDRLSPEYQLLPGDIEWLGEIPTMGGKNIDVYKGRFIQGEDLKIKVIRFVNTKGEKAIQRIKREIELWAEINNLDQGRHTVLFYGFFMPGGPRLALVSPWMNNGSVLEYVKKHDKDVDYQKLILGIAEGIKVLHSMVPPVVHGNLRAENVLIGDKGQPLISDFTLTKPEGTLITRTVGELDGCRWCAPEMCEGQDIVSAKGDIYSFGMTVLELFTHDIPYANIRNGFQVINRKLSNGGLPDRPRDESVIERGLDDNAWGFLCHCWSKDPKDRPSMTQDRVDEIIQKFRSSDSRASVDKIESLVEENKVANHEVQFSQIKLFLQSLLTILKLEPLTEGHALILDLVCAVLDFPDYGMIVAEVQDPSEVELLLDLVFGLLRNGKLSRSGIQDAGRKARRLMFRLISKTDVVPKSLFITDVTIEADRGVVGSGGFGRVFRGKYQEQQVALKVVDKGHHNRSLRNQFCREALAWRSLTHQFILPLLGIFEEKSQLFLVSPFMANGTLSQWRKKNQSPNIDEIHRLLLEVAEGIQYLHSEGIVHGDLHGGNVLLDEESELHCQITDFGLTRHSEAPFTRPTTTFLSHFAAPELFGLCPKCAHPDCHGCGEQGRTKTMLTDVYAYGCLYYAIFFDVTPFQGMNDYQIMRSVTSGLRPDRLENPRLDDETWDLIQSCWKTKPSERPTMGQILETIDPLIVPEL